MTTPPTSEVLPELPVVPYITANGQPLCKVSDALAAIAAAIAARGVGGGQT
jgi:hypothetical protein